MPELPEVETLRRDLSDRLVGRTISGGEVVDRRALEGFGPDGSVRRAVEPGAFVASLAGRRVEAVTRRGKYLIVVLDRGCLLVHLRMTGQLLWGAPRPRARVRLFFKDTKDVLSFCDTRRFGEMWLSPSLEADASVSALGPEPLDRFDERAWSRSFRICRAPAHAALLDQRRLAGLGNIYVTEALFLAGVRPTRRCHRVSVEEVGALLKHTRSVLRLGIRHRGVSFRDYRDASGQKGQAKDRLLVYGKSGFPCPSCGAVLRRVVVGGRGTVYCAGCQR